MDGVDSIRALLRGNTIVLQKLEDNTGIFDQVDAFVNLSRGNETIQEVVLYPGTDPSDDASGTQRHVIWEKVAEGIGNLQALRKISIRESIIVDDEGDFLPSFAPDWEILACIFRRLRRGIQLNVKDGSMLWHWVVPNPEGPPNYAELNDRARNLERMQVFTGVIHEQAMVTGFTIGHCFPFHCFDTLCCTLLTLPALENVSFSHMYRNGQDMEEGQSLESVVQLLQSPALRQVKFYSVSFSNSLHQVIAKALKDRSEITDLHFCGCSFLDGGGTAIVSALTTNTTLKCLEFDSFVDVFTNRVFPVNEKVFYDTLAKVLLSNSTLQELAISTPGRDCLWLSPLFLALEVNTVLKVLRIYFSSFRLVGEASLTCIYEKLSTAMMLGIGKNSTLESLHLSNVKLGGNDNSLWREAFSFLRTNTALKALHVNFEPNVTESHATAIRMDVLAVLRENDSLETLSMINKHARLDDYLVFVAAIYPNTTLKSLQLYPLQELDICVNQDEVKDLIPILKKNYGLEEMSGLLHGAEDVHSILQLNGAGRRYLVHDGFSISKGVDVLSGVSNDINSVFLHLLENPRLCTRSAVEISDSSSSPVNHNGDSGGGGK
jgi:hypothetical protein